MPNVRKPRPPKKPETLSELILDLDERLEGGDALSDVWFEGADWIALVDRAEHEKNVRLAVGSEGAQVQVFNGTTEEAAFEKGYQAGLDEGAIQAAKRDDASSTVNTLSAELASARGIATNTEKALTSLRTAMRVVVEAHARGTAANWAGNETTRFDALVRSLPLTPGSTEEPDDEPKGVTGPACDFCEEIGHTRAECGVAPKEEDFEDRAVPAKVPKPFKTGMESPLSEKKPDRYCQRCSKYHPKGEHSVAKAEKKPAYLPFMVRVGEKLIGPPSRFKDRQAAVDGAKLLGHTDFEVVDDTGKVWNSVKVDPPKKSRRMKMKDEPGTQEEAPF